VLPAKPNLFIQGWFNWYCRFALRKFFHRVHLFGNVPFDPKRSTIYVVNHASFWDVIAVNFLIHSRRRQPIYCMSDIVQMRRHPFFRRVGAFSVDRTNPRDGLRAIAYAADLLNRSPCSVVMFPQGKIEPADQRPIRFERGIARLMDRCPDATVVMVTLRYEFWLDQRAELLMDLSSVGDKSIPLMEMQMISRLDKLASAGKEFGVGDQILLTGRKSIQQWDWSKPITPI
jgi:1-acyl-sn-glycerol-3-phosphate acyltransferase